MQTKILLLANAATIEAEISKIANNDARKKLWVLIDGVRMPKDLAKETGVTTMTVSNFLNVALAAEFIEYAPRQPPKRILDYVPPSWLGLIELPKIEEPSEPADPTEKSSTEQEK